MSLYTNLFRPALFRLNPESVHDMAVKACGIVGATAIGRIILRRAFNYRDQRLECTVAGMHLVNPVGLAAGWDKSGVGVTGGSCLGFGFYEIGSVSADLSHGNPKPRLFRLPQDQAVIVHFGLQNDGADVVARRVGSKPIPIPLGINIVKTNRGIDGPPESEDEIFEDYLRSTRVLKEAADYLVYNLSCPNTETGRDFFGEPGRIRRLVTLLEAEQIRRPVFLKISPLGGGEALDRVLEETGDCNLVSGFMLNLPPGKVVPLQTPEKAWRDLPGAVAGRPVEMFINDRLAELYRRIDRRRHCIIAAGGVFSAEDAYRKIRLGASAVQVLTGMVYEGPGLIARINRGLSSLLDRDGFANIEDAVGVDNRR
ncbi:MAG: quinone-dependent dihydroorotate dehydrogenase [Lentisphaerae bacterium]|nr:quinone-dependent dihydroorotate dehydrogenase [Lentisphaerota bacterium]